jgi:hypothetical protein
MKKASDCKPLPGKLVVQLDAIFRIGHNDFLKPQPLKA